MAPADLIASQMVGGAEVSSSSLSAARFVHAAPASIQTPRVEANILGNLACVRARYASSAALSWELRGTARKELCGLSILATVVQTAPPVTLFAGGPQGILHDVPYTKV